MEEGPPCSDSPAPLLGLRTPRGFSSVGRGLWGRGGLQRPWGLKSREDGSESRWRPAWSVRADLASVLPHYHSLCDVKQVTSPL